MMFTNENPGKIKALSIYPKWAMLIALGIKKVENRSWKTNYRGPLVICSTKAYGGIGTIPGHAICVVDLVDIKKYEDRHYGWILKNPRYIKPKPVKGRQGIFEIKNDLECIPETDEKTKTNWLEENFYPKILGAKQINNSWFIPEPSDEPFKN